MWLYVKKLEKKMASRGSRIWIQSLKLDTVNMNLNIIYLIKKLTSAQSA